MNKFYYLLICLSLGLSYGIMAQEVTQEIESNKDETKPSNPFSLEHIEGSKVISITLEIDNKIEEADISFGNIGKYSLGISSTGGRVVPDIAHQRPTRPNRPGRTSESSRQSRTYDAKACSDLNELDLLYSFLVPQLKAGNSCFMEVSKNNSKESGFCSNKSGELLMNFSIYYSDLVIPEDEKLKCKKVVHISLSK